MKPLLFFAAAPAAFLAVALNDLTPAIQKIPELVGAHDWVTLGVIIALSLLLIFSERIAELDSVPANNIRQFLIWIAVSWLQSRGALPKETDDRNNE